MSIMQAAQEVAKQGTSGITLILPTGVISAVSTAIAIKVLDKLAAKKNGNGKGPGKADVCIERGLTLARMDEKQKNVEKDIGEIKTAVEKIETAALAILQRIPPKEN